MRNWASGDPSGESLPIVSVVMKLTSFEDLECSSAEEVSADPVLIISFGDPSDYIKHIRHQQI